MTAIEFENISKQYQLGKIGTGTLSHDLNRWWARIRGKEDPYLRIGQVNNRASKAEGDFVWALRDINLKVEQGDVLGIIGKNGSGKSTLLKILSKVTSPTTGHIRGRGRVASLLEVGTGFHPEMTGRENIYMNGAIMGMSKAEIDRKFDEIVDFAGVQMYVDTPVKRYSSGMTVRLGFAIAAHLEPEILVVDEVLAVGDAEFQKKAIGKMQDVSKGQGRTVLFVSHNMGSVRSLCNRGILLDKGHMIFDGNVDDAINLYNSQSISISTKRIVDSIVKCEDYLHIEQILFNGTELSETTFESNQPTVELSINGYTDKPIDAEPKIVFKNLEESPIMAYAEGRNLGRTQRIENQFCIKRTIKLPVFLARGVFKVDIYLHLPLVKDYLYASNCIIVHSEGNFAKFGYPIELKWDGVIGLSSL